MTLRDARIAGQEAGRRGRSPALFARSDVSDEALAYHHAWLVTKVEFELGEKLLPDVPSDGSDVRICSAHRHL